VHDANHLARSLDDGVVGRGLGFEQVEHDHRAVGELPVAIARDGRRVGVQVMDAAARRTKKWAKKWGQSEFALETAT
jgi:hypothetical protein